VATTSQAGIREGWNNTPRLGLQVLLVTREGGGEENESVIKKGLTGHSIFTLGLKKDQNLTKKLWREIGTWEGGVWRHNCQERILVELVVEFSSTRGSGERKKESS